MSKALKLILPLTALSIAITGCGETKRVLGMKKNPPNEFTVMQRAPLEVPPEFNLRPPQPGVKRPQEKNRPTASQKAKSALTRSNRVSRKTSRSSLDSKLLAQAGASKADSKIRSKVDTEAYMAKHGKQDENWIRRNLAFKKKSGGKHVLNAKKESERLKRG